MRLPARRLALLAELSRPARRRLTPGRFKETYINQVLDAHAYPTYLEIGVRRGESFRTVHAARKLGVDPDRTQEMSVLRPGEEYFAMTSDGFFADHAPATLAPRSVHVALIDGLHEFRQAARDVLHLEPFMHRQGIIFLDDFNPKTRERATDTPTGGPWNGDVWKLAPFLSKARPDLQLWTIDADEGIGVLAGFGRGASDDLTALLQEYKELSYDYLAGDRASVLKMISPAYFTQLLPSLLGNSRYAGLPGIRPA